MAGYMLVEQKSLQSPQNSKGIPPNSQKIGIVDFLRELSQDEFPYNENSSLLVTGIEEYLLAARPEMEEAARQVKKILRSASIEFDRKMCPDVQIVFKQPLVRGEHLMVNHVTTPLPVFLIFGTPLPTDISGQTVYIAQFNLSGN